MKRLLRTSMLGAALAGAAAATAQVNTTDYVDQQFSVSSPSSIAGLKSYTINTGTGWGTFPSSNYINVPVKRVPTPDSLNCSVPSGSYAGTFAFFYRGDCEFGAKALNAQNAGAIGAIIVNNIPGEPVGMGGGAVGTQVNIPMVMVSQADGAAIRAALVANQNVRISLTRWGSNLNTDLAIIPTSVAAPPYQAIPLVQMTGNASVPRPYRFYTGSYLANFSSASSANGGDQTNVKVRSFTYFTPNGQNATLVHRDSITKATFVRNDSVDLSTFLDTVGYTHTPSSNGVYNIYYDVSASSPDDFLANNTDSTLKMYVTDSVFTKSRWDAAAMRPVLGGGTRLNSNGDFTLGQLFYVTKGGYGMRKIQYYAGSDSPGVFRFTAQFNGRVWKWVDGQGTGFTDNIMQIPELTLVAIGTNNFAATDSTYKLSEMQLRTPNGNFTPRTESNTWYFVALGTDDENIRIGIDGSLNYFTRADVTSGASGDTTKTDFWAPYTGSSITSINSQFAGSIYMLPFYTSNNIFGTRFLSIQGTQPAMAWLLSKDVVTGVETVANPISEFNVFPNPATTEITMDFKSKTQLASPTVYIMNMMGQTVATHTINANGKTTVSINTLAPGQYYVVLTGANSTAGQKITVLAH